MVLERQLAKEGGYEDPINPSKEVTAACYDKCAAYYLNNKCQDSYF